MIDAKRLTAFLDSRTEYRSEGNPRRRRRYVNGVVIDQDTDARIIRRWRSTITNVTPPAAERLLARVGLTPDDFHRWTTVNP